MCCRDPEYTDPWPQCLELQPGTQKYIMMGCAGKRRKRSIEEEQPKDAEIESRISYVPPTTVAKPVCGVEYDCVPSYLCDEYGDILTSGAGLLDLKKGLAPGEEAVRFTYSL